MARNVVPVTISAEGRDKGKQFLIREMPADQGERWAARLIFALMNAGVQIPDNAEHAGMAGLAAIGLNELTLSQIRFETIEPMWEEMFQCVSYQPPDARLQPQKILAGDNSQIEEIATRLQLRQEVLKLHFSFFTRAATPTTAAAAPASPG